MHWQLVIAGIYIFCQMLENQQKKMKVKWKKFSLEFWKKKKNGSIHKCHFHLCEALLSVFLTFFKRVWQQCLSVLVFLPFFPFFFSVWSCWDIYDFEVVVYTVKIECLMYYARNLHSLISVDMIGPLKVHCNNIISMVMNTW